MLDPSNNSSSSKRRKRPRQSNVVFVMEMISALAGAGAVIVGGMYALGRFCWWAAPGSTGGGRRGCGDLAKYSYRRMTEPDFVPPDIVATGDWFILLIAVTIAFGAAAFIVDRVQRGPK